MWKKIHHVRVRRRQLRGKKDDQRKVKETLLPSCTPPFWNPGPAAARKQNIHLKSSDVAFWGGPGTHLSSQVGFLQPFGSETHRKQQKQGRADCHTAWGWGAKTSTPITVYEGILYSCMEPIRWECLKPAAREEIGTSQEQNCAKEKGPLETGNRTGGSACWPSQCL